MNEALSSLMAAEAREAPQAVARLLDADAALYAELAARWQAAPPPGLLTVARGSSDHAAQHFAALAMQRLARPVCSLPPSLVTLHQARLQVAGWWALAMSQSGRSPDLLETTTSLRAQGAFTLAAVNETGSPLAHTAQVELPLHAGPERSVAATKSFIAQLALGVRLVAHCADDMPLLNALHALPPALQRAVQADWSAALPVLAVAQRLYVIGRGTGLAVAQEAALKLKETCLLPAEAFSGAELAHGPMALVGPGFTLLVLAPPGPAQAGLLATAAAMRERGARVLLAAPAGTPGVELPIEPAGHDDLQGLSTVQSFYGMVEALARARGLDPDRPPHLAKVTHTR